MTDGDGRLRGLRPVAWLIPLLVLPLAARPVAGQPSQLAFLYYGESDPTGVDQAFLALGHRRSATVLHEVPGQLDEEPASARLARAVAGYQALRFKEAVAELDGLDRTLVVRGGGGLTLGELVDLYAYRAAARIALGDESSAWDDLVALSTLAPSRPLDPARFSPRLIDAARRAAQSLGNPARLVVDGVPGDALLIVDGQLIGRGHVEASVIPGRHLIRGERSGFRAAGSIVEVPATGAATRLTLEPLPPPSAAELVRLGLRSGASELLAAYVSTSAGRAVVSLDRFDVRTGKRLGHAELSDDERITSGILAAAIDGLLASGSEPAPATAAPPRRWYQSPLLWGLVGGAAGAALGVGLGVGLTTAHPTGTGARIDLGPAR